eukprot:CAMPEP_0171161112 /NCGR_PEP_ID=MMETSP0790-20130122/3904_1 /TAXON_ID=2925 /ORGANISM="Alexandrium catenella, Strain OF101" /LENGTH=303 /DNA_ID=CAMNT_0011625665 /DNA_START=116 /DNA_END=1026 /DNA_ORIENTATION=+
MDVQTSSGTTSTQKSGAIAEVQGHRRPPVHDDAGWDPAKEVMDSLRLAAEDVARFLEVDQRFPNGVAHPDWLEARRNRVTASRFASAYATCPEGVVKAMMVLPEGEPSNAHRFGVRCEEVARQAYVQERRKAGREADPPYVIEVREVGVCAWEQEPWLAASPDGIVCENGVPCGLLEVKTARFWTDEAEERLWRNMPCDWVYQVQGGMRLASAALGTQQLGATSSSGHPSAASAGALPSMPSCGRGLSSRSSGASTLSGSCPALLRGRELDVDDQKVQLAGEYNEGEEEAVTPLGCGATPDLG